MYKSKPREKKKLTECFLNILGELESLHKTAKGLTAKQESTIKAELTTPLKKRIKKEVTKAEIKENEEEEDTKSNEITKTEMKVEKAHKNKEGDEHQKEKVIYFKHNQKYSYVIHFLFKCLGL